MDRFLRGSEWRRWDLHVHTPETKKNDQYAGSTTEEKWNNFYEAISDYIGDGTDSVKNIAVIGITDYLSIDNYMKVKEENRLPQTVKLILPNVEIRIMPPSKTEPVNMHFIFNPEFASKLKTRFFSYLEFCYDNRKYHAIKEELIELGKSFNPSFPEDVAYREGIDKFIASIDNISDIFKNDRELRENTIIILSNSSNDGASGVDKDCSQMALVRKNLYIMTDMLFSANPRDVGFFLGKNVDSPEEIINKYNALKPCVHGSDAHSIDKLFEPDLKRYCWIKADPTFNGLKQIMYEPEVRVRISPTLPETKPSYHVIESVEVRDNVFQKEKIVLNDKLNCVIGGKSTGKSLLLKNIAVAVDRNQAKIKLGSNLDEKRLLNEVIVHWADGSDSILTNKAEQDLKHKIVYIPQTYLNRLTDNQQEKTEIDSIIKEILLQDDSFSERDKAFNKSIKDKNQLLSKKLYDLLQKYDSIKEKRNKLSEIGNFDGIEKEIKRLEAEKEKLSHDSELSLDDILSYEDKSNEYAKNQKLLSNNCAMRRQLDSVSELVERVEIPYFIDSGISKCILEAQNRVIQEADKLWAQEKFKIQKLLDDTKDVLLLQNKELEDYLTSMSKKISSNKAFQNIAGQIQEQRNKLEEYKDKVEELKVLNADYNELKDLIVDGIIEYKIIHDTYAKYSSSNIEDHGLNFSIETVLKVERFKSFINKNLDRRSIKTFQSKLNFDVEELDITKFNEELIGKIIELALSGDINLVKSTSTEIFLKELQQDWYESLYRITMDDDCITEMSPGKKAIVLLKLLIQMADSTCPILIDQPEDDLDNRSIFKDLIPFIRKKKLDRQFIVVTHNANIVLGGDAEEVIVANRNGAKTPNKEYIFEYLTGSIENNIAINKMSDCVLPKNSIQGHICEIMEGGQEAFNLRKNKYNM